jgi:non-specific serine/threonine protein kinase
MDWSHDLLPEKERIPFRRLSVFAGGFALDAAEAVCAGEHFGPEEVLDSLSDLVAKSLVVAAERDGAARYRLLETVRQYGREKLEESGELDLLEERHARHYLALAEEAEPELRGARQGEWLDRLETEHDNLRAALAWTLEVGEAELGLRLGGALGEFWHLRGHLDEGQRWLQAVLTNGGEASEPVRARVLAQAGWIAWEQGDYERAVSLTEKSLALSRKIGDERISALALLVQGMSRMRQGDELERASELIEESVALHRATGDAAGLSRALLGLGIVAVLRGDYEHAATLHEEGLALAREAADNFAINIALMQGALVHLSRGDHRMAVALTEEGLALAWHLRMLHATAAHLDISSGLAGARGQAARSARLWGAAEALRESIGAPISPVERFYFAPLTAAAKSELGEAAWEAELAEGRTMTPEQAVEYALSTHEAAPSSSHDSSSSLLSARETEVLALVAEGLTNPQVAQRLYLSPRTVGQHLRSVYRKLGVSSRAAAVREASERGMI